MKRYVKYQRDGFDLLTAPDYMYAAFSERPVLEDLWDSAWGDRRTGISRIGQKVKGCSSGLWREIRLPDPYTLNYAGHAAADKDLGLVLFRVMVARRPLISDLERAEYPGGIYFALYDFDDENFLFCTSNQTVRHLAKAFLTAPEAER